MELNSINNKGAWSEIAAALNQNFLKILAELLKYQHVTTISGANFLGYFTSSSVLPNPAEAAWAVAGDLKAVTVYAYYTSDAVPSGFSAGWNALSSLGTYDFTDYSNLLTKVEETDAKVSELGSKEGSLITFEMGGLDVDNGKEIENNIRIRSKFIGITLSGNTRKRIRLRKPESLSVRYLSSKDRYAVLGYNNGVFYSIASYAKINGNYVEFDATGAYDSVRIMLSKENDSEITENELKQCSANIVLDFEDIEKIEENISELAMKEGMTVGFNFGGLDYDNGKVIDNNVRLYSDKIGVNKGRNIKFIRIQKPSNIILPYSETYNSYSIFGYSGDSYVKKYIGYGYVKKYDDYIRVELTNIDDIDNIRIVLADKTFGEILDSDRLKCHAYIDRDAEFQNSVVPFEYGAVDAGTGDFYENKIRIRARLFFKPYQNVVDTYKYFRVNAPESLIPIIRDSGAYVAYAYLGNTPIKKVPSLSIENNVGKFKHDGTFDNIIICYIREDKAEITEEELRQCSVETELALKNQITEASRDILKVENRLRNDLPIAFQKIKFVYGSTLVDGGDYVNNYPIGSDTQNRIRLRSEPIFIEKNGKVRINITNYGDLKLYGYAAIYKGIDNVGRVQLDTRFKDFIILNKEDDSYDNIVITLMKDNDEEITAEERDSIFAYGQIGEVSTRPKEHGTLKYCALGDSITYGFIPRNAEGYPGQLKSYARLTAEKLGMNFLNYGISGSTVANKENAMSVRYTEMPSDADIITVMGGTNDQWRGVLLGTMSDRSINTFYGALHVLYQGLYTKYIANAEYSAGAKKKIIVLTPLKKLDPNKSALENTIENNSDILMPLEDFVKAVKEVAAFYSFPVLDFYNLSGINPHLNRTVVGTESGYTGNYNPYIVDGTHPTAEGHEMMADLLVGFIRSLNR